MSWGPGPRPALLLLGGALALLGGCSQTTAEPPLEIPAPSNPERLDPQVRAHVEEVLARARAAPDDVQAQAELGLAYAANDLWAEALVAFRIAAELDPDAPLAALYVAGAQQELGRLDDALAGYRDVARRFPDFPQGHYHLGEALLRAGDVDAAEPVFERLARLAPDEWRARAGLGEVALRRSEFERAAGHLEQAALMSHGAKVARHQLGLAYRALGRREEAERELRAGLDATKSAMADEWARRMQDHAKVLKDQFRRAGSYWAAGRNDEAVALLEGAARWHPDNPDVLLSLGLAFLYANRAQDAYDALQKVLAVDEARFRAHVNLVPCCLRLGRLDEGLKHADRAAELAAPMAEPHVSRASVLLALNRDAEALAAMRTALECEPQSAKITMQVGDVCLKMGRAAEAKRYYEEAARKDPSLGDVYVRLAHAHLQLGELPDAETATKTVRRLAPGHPQLAALERRLGLEK